MCRYCFLCCQSVYQSLLPTLNGFMREFCLSLLSTNATDIFAQVRLHILLQLDGLAEWMPAMAEQVGFKSIAQLHVVFSPAASLILITFYLVKAVLKSTLSDVLPEPRFLQRKNSVF